MLYVLIVISYLFHGTKNEVFYWGFLHYLCRVWQIFLYLFIQCTPQDFQSMFGHFASLCMEELKVQVKLRSHSSSKKWKKKKNYSKIFSKANIKLFWNYLLISSSSRHFERKHDDIGGSWALTKMFLNTIFHFCARFSCQ